MSGTPKFAHRPPHRNGTTLRAFSLDIAHEGTGLPKDLTGLTASMTWEDQNGSQVAEWVLGDPLKPGLTVTDPESGRIYIGADAEDPLPIPLGTTLLRGDLKIVIGETFVPFGVVIPVFEGVD